MCDVETVTIVTHGDLMSFGCAYAHQGVSTGQVSVVHDQGVTTLTAYHNHVLGPDLISFQSAGNGLGV